MVHNRTVFILTLCLDMIVIIYTDLNNLWPSTGMVRMHNLQCTMIIECVQGQLQ